VVASPLYEIALVGDPSMELLFGILAELDLAVSEAKLEIGRDVKLSINPTVFQPSDRTASVLVFLGGPGTKDIDLSSILVNGDVPILPVSTHPELVSDEIPAAIGHLNCLFAPADPKRIVSGILESVGLLPAQRRVFLSYRRSEARGAAVQLFNELSARHFEVFLDTHGIAPGVDFQAGLWHRLCDADVLIMLDTPNYFLSRWTEAEFGRALSKGISVLRVGWPDSTPSRRTETASRVELLAREIDAATGELSPAAIERISSQLEQVRSLGHATRQLSMIGNVRAAVERVQGVIENVGLHRALHIRLASGQCLVAHFAHGVPTAVALQQTVVRSKGKPAALIYDHIGLLPEWQEHLDWLGAEVKAAKWVKLSEAAWAFGGWDT
jgi:hypothetical protein